MSARVLNISDSEAHVHISDVACPATFGAALRRYLVDRVPCMAIERVRIIENGGCIPDETLAHALGLLPLRVHGCIDMVPFPGQCSVCGGGEEGCDICGAEIGLHIDGGETETVVTSDDLQVKQSDVQIACPPIVLTQLPPMSKMHVVCTAHKGMGSVHAKWSSVCGPRSIPDSDGGGVTLQFETTGAHTPPALLSWSIAELVDDLEALRTQFEQAS